MVMDGVFRSLQLHFALEKREGVWTGSVLDYWRWDLRYHRVFISGYCCTACEEGGEEARTRLVRGRRVSSF